ncbi:hypothetical protein F2Q69_00003799 [Brassica cretica]|uniref:Uncharacterized protein n=1 Tax=Brassica cretica TaxID=69181 RepID=A0A8S9PHD4_BRACR|nr:hypothetical protein F2Q69_00003799 [Brassica cretica]
MRPSDSRYHPHAEICARSLQVDHNKVINYLTELEKEKLKVENNFKDDFEGRVQNQGAKRDVKRSRVCEAQQWLLQMPKGGSNINTEKLRARPSLIGRVGATSAAVISFKTNYIQRETHQFDDNTATLVVYARLAPSEFLEDNIGYNHHTLEHPNVETRETPQISVFQLATALNHAPTYFLAVMTHVPYAEPPSPCTLQGHIRWRSCVIDYEGFMRGNRLLLHLAPDEEGGRSRDGEVGDTASPNPKRNV